MNIGLMKKLDAVVGFLATSTLPAPLQRNVAFPVTSLLLIRPGGIGDAALLAPAIVNIKKCYPAIHITVLAEQRNAGVFSLIPAVDMLLCYDRPGELLQALHCRYDVVIDTEQWHRLSAVVARFVSAPVKIGFDTNERRRMFTHPVPYSHGDYETASFVHLLEPLGIETEVVEKAAPFLSLSVAASEKAAGLLEPLDGKPLIVIFPGASIVERRWGAERFSQVAGRLSKKGYGIVVVGGYEDLEDGYSIVGDTGIILAGKATLAETAAIISRSTLLISGDSGVLHLAVGLDVPTVSLFGPGIAAKWAPLGERHVVLNHQLPCSPCTRFGTTPPCPIKARCIRDISPDEVMEAIGRLLSLPPEKK